jgi:hypothetical protein
MILRTQTYKSWHLFDAADEVAYEDMVQGATIIPLGELFTRKRCGKYKFRQIAMVNMLKKGRDYGETFSSTITKQQFRLLSTEDLCRNSRVIWKDEC